MTKMRSFDASDWQSFNGAEPFDSVYAGLSAIDPLVGDFKDGCVIADRNGVQVIFDIGEVIYLFVASENGQSAWQGQALADYLLTNLDNFARAGQYSFLEERQFIRIIG